MVGVKAHTLENELLSFKRKSHMMGKGSEVALHCDSSLLVTLA